MAVSQDWLSVLGCGAVGLAGPGGLGEEAEARSPGSSTPGGLRNPGRTRKGEEPGREVTAELAVSRAQAGPRG